MDLFYVALNLAVVALIGLGVLVARIRSRRSKWVELQSTMQPDRTGQELTDVVTEWAKVTGLLTADGAPDRATGRGDDLLDSPTDQRG